MKSQSPIGDVSIKRYLESNYLLSIVNIVRH